MRAASPALIAYINALRASHDARAIVADCFTFTLQTGLILTYTNADVPVTLNGYVYAANSILVDGLKFKCALGLEVDQQQITISARQTDTVGGVPFLQAMATSSRPEPKGYQKKQHDLVWHLSVLLRAGSNCGRGGFSACPSLRPPHH